MKLYTILAVLWDSTFETYGSYTDKAKAEAEADRINRILNAKQFAWKEEDPNATDDDLRSWIWEDGWVIHILESTLEGE